MQQHRPSKIIVVDGYSHKILKNSYTKYLQRASISDWRSWSLQNPKKITRYRRLLNPLVTSGRKKVFKTVEWVIAPGISPRERNSRGGILVAGRLPDTSLSFTNRKQFARHSFNLFAGIRLSPKTSKTSESKASLSLAEQWTENNYRNSLTIKFCADVFPARKCPSLKYCL